MSPPWRTSTSGLPYYRKLHFMKLRDLLFFYQVQCRRGWWNLRERGVLWGIQEKILGVKEGSPKHFFKFCLDGICNDATAYQNTKNQCFWRPERLDFPWETCPQPPTLLCTKKQFYLTKMQNLRAIILTNQLKTTWPSSNGTPSNAVNILYVCYFLELPKFLLRLLVFFLQRQLIPDNVCSLLMAIQNV